MDFMELQSLMMMFVYKSCLINEKMILDFDQTIYVSTARAIYGYSQVNGQIIDLS